MSHVNRDELPICVACGTQFQTDKVPARCRICDDPRQFVPPEGQKWTTHKDLRREHRNEIIKIDGDEGLWFIRTAPKFGIGQRAFFLETDHGNVMWDCVALLDQKTIDFINSKGGLKAIVISHPHFYTTHCNWAETFNCPVYTAAEDKEWLNADCSLRKLITTPTQEIIPGVTAVKGGGHFDGSMVFHWATRKRLFVADTIMPVQAGRNPPEHRTDKTPAFTFMWSYPNVVPLHPDAIAAIWAALKNLDFEIVYGLFEGLEVRGVGKGNDVKKRVLQSMKIHLRAQGWDNHVLLEEEVPT